MTEGLLAAHLLAPSRWRRILQQSKGPFEGWKALVAVTDAKKRAAYKTYVPSYSSLLPLHCPTRQCFPKTLNLPVIYQIQETALHRISEHSDELKYKPLRCLKMR